MATRIPPLRNPPIAFAHRGARAVERDNTIPSFLLAARLGATGMESDVWLTRDGVPILDHDGQLGRLRRRPISSLDRADLPDHIPTLAEYYEHVGTSFDLSLDLKDPSHFEPVVAVTRNASPEMVNRLWLCFGDHEIMQEWRRLEPDVRIVDSTRHKRISEGPERRAADLANWGIDAINMRQDDWTGGLTTLFHRFDVLAFAWDVQFDRTLAATLDIGIDAVYSDHVDRMVDALTSFHPDTFVPGGI
ncbi:MAG: glycerophosphodiester phosphodiesterase [Acidimicrobiales bacterium]|nr:glycerophosphodiester phosphodiesterase [Acidimicrobiales bacterium]